MCRHRFIEEGSSALGLSTVETSMLPSKLNDSNSSSLQRNAECKQAIPLESDDFIHSPERNSMSIPATNAEYDHQEVAFQFGFVDEPSFPPDTYFEGECDVGPRLLQRPIHLVAANPITNEVPLVKGVLAFNKALAHHLGNDVEEALETYGLALESLTSTILPSRGCSASYTSCVARLSMFVHNNVGHIRYMEGEEEEALVHFQTAICWLDHLREHPASECEDEMWECKATVLSNYARTQWMQGNANNEIAEIFQAVLHLREKHLSKDHVDVVSAHLNLGFLLYAKNRKVEALSHLRRYLEVAENSPARTRLDPVPALSYVVLIENEEREDALSVELVRAVRALQDKREDFGAGHVEVASLLNYIGTILFHRRELKSALQFYKEELYVEESIVDDAPGISISVTYNNIGRIHQELGELQKAIACYRKALKTGGDSGLCPQSVVNEFTTNGQEVLKDSQSMSQSSMNLFSTIWYNLGLIYDRRGHKGNAIRAFQMSLAIRQSLLGRDHADVACLWYNIGTLQMETRLLDQASKSLRESLRIRRLGNVSKTEGQHHVVMTLKKLYSLQQKRGQIDEALVTLSEMAQLQVHDEASDLELSTTYRQMSELHHAKGDVDAAIRHAHRSFEVMLSSTILMDANNVNHMKGVEEVITTLLMISSLYHEACDAVEAQLTLQKAQGLIEMMLQQYGSAVSLNLLSSLEVIRFMRSRRCAAAA